MTEEIIIDGVNVAGCIFSCKYNVGIACCCDNIRDDKIPFANFCEENKDCYYKQLKRLEFELKVTKADYEASEQENKQMKSALEKIRDLCIHYENTNDKCVINCYAHFIVTDLIQNKIKEVLK